MNKKSISTYISLLLVTAFLMSACQLSTFFAGNPTKTIVPSRTAAPGTLVPGTQIPQTGVPTVAPSSTSDMYAAPFAQYKIRTYSIPAAYTGGYSLPLTSDQVSGIDKFDFSASQIDAILKNGFVVVPPSSDPNKRYLEFYQAYESLRYEALPVFATTDAVFHVYHLIFDKMLRDLERNSFIDKLKELTTAMLNESVAQYKLLKGSDLQVAALRNVAYFTVPAIILGLPVSVPNAAKVLADAEVTLIEAGKGFEISPIWNTGNQAGEDVLLEDYSQYIPRGHYTRDASLKAYFKAMMWYGRMTFRLKDPVETQRALLTVQAMRNAPTTSGKTALQLWQNIYDPTVFIVGKADDLSIYEYGKLSDEIFGKSPDLQSFADSKLINAFNDAVKKLPPPQINSMWVYIWQDRDQATQGFRFIGQRFTLDAYVFGQLIWRKVGTLDNPRDLPKSLDFLAAQGSEEAYSILKDMGETQYANYDTQLTKVKTEVAAFGLDSWTQNLYWSWLYALQPIFTPKGAQYPAFMQTQAWLRKDLQTALGSWTELKHDTILYAKQVMAEMGGGESTPPRSYVEPNLEAYARLLALAEMTRNGLNDRGLLDDLTKANLDNLIDELNFLLEISQKELSGEQISNDEYLRIQYFGGWLEAMTIAAADPADNAEGRAYLEDQKSALVADVATGLTKVLEEGVGYPTRIFVVVPETREIAIGAVYTYYEFTVDPVNRLTDTEWQAMLEGGNAPAAPDWTSTFIIP